MISTGIELTTIRILAERSKIFADLSFENYLATTALRSAATFETLRGLLKVVTSNRPFAQMLLCMRKKRYVMMSKVTLPSKLWSILHLCGRSSLR